MTGTAKAAAQKVVELLMGTGGINRGLEAVSLPPVQQNQVLAQNVTLEIAERSGESRYPAVHVYCEKLRNELKEKFRAFSGTAVMTVEMRVTQDRLEGLEQRLQLSVDAVTQVLERNRGDWGNGMFFSGAYEVAFAPVKHGGKNFIQVAKVTLEVGVSRN